MKTPTKSARRYDSSVCYAAQAGSLQAVYEAANRARSAALVASEAAPQDEALKAAYEAAKVAGAAAHKSLWDSLLLARPAGPSHERAVLGNRAHPRKTATMTTSTWTYEGFRNAVLGAHATPSKLAQEFGLDLSDRPGIDAWLGTAESEAWTVGGHPGDVPAEWSGFHAKALDELCAT